VDDGSPSKIRSADAAAALVRDGTTVVVTGSGGGLLEPDALLAAIGRRFLATGHPRGLTLVHAQGIGDGTERGLNHVAHEGLVRRVIGAHWTWSPAMQALAAAEKIEAYALPGGVIQHLVREIGAKRPGLITKVGLDSFVDPRREGGRMNRSAAEPINEVVTIGGQEYLRYFPFPIDVALVRGTTGDARGNIGFADEGGELDVLVMAIAAHNCGGVVLAQVRREAVVGAQPPHATRLPGTLVDAVVVEPAQRWSHAGDRDEIPAVLPEAAPVERRVIAARAYRELVPGKVVSFGFGIPDGVASIARRRGAMSRYRTTLDHGHHGGDALQGALFGFVPNGEAMIDSPSQFDFYSGGGIDIAMLGFGEIDADGDVNVSKLGGRIIGPGGFIDIAQGARRLVFCGAFEGKGMKVAVAGGRLAIERPGSLAKLVATVEQVTFSGPRATATGQDVLYVTERAVFRLTPEGVSLAEVAPGIDVAQDIVARMGFAPLIPPGGPAAMPPECFDV
jgi:propionate CoA-transferase